MVDSYYPRDIKARNGCDLNIRYVPLPQYDAAQARICELEAALYKIMERTDPPDEDYYDAYHALKGNEREI